MSDILHGGRLPSFAVCERQEAPVITSLGGPLARILRDTLRYTHSKTPRTTSRRCASTYALRSRIQLKALDATNPVQLVAYIPLSTLRSKEIQNIRVIVGNFTIKIKLQKLQFILNVLRKD